MKRRLWLVLLLVLSLPAVTQCSQPARSAGASLDVLALHVPADAAVPVLFVDLQPAGEMGRRWQYIRSQLAANPAGESWLQALDQQFGFEAQGLDRFIYGPVAHFTADQAYCFVMQANDEVALEEALIRYFDDVIWLQEEQSGRVIHHGMTYKLSIQSQELAWSTFDGLLLYVYGIDALAQMERLVGLAPEHSLAEMPVWRTLRARLPENPMGFAFAHLGEQARQSPPSPDDTSVSTGLLLQFEALALAVVPEAQGLRLQLAGDTNMQVEAMPTVRAMFDAPSVDAGDWDLLPDDTVIALFGHDMSVVWPMLNETIVTSQLQNQIRDAIGLDLAADLAGPDGPLSGDFAAAVTPPLPDQPITQGIPAAQLLILARGVSEAQMADVGAAMEGRGSIFGPGEVRGVSLQTQAGTRPSGYAASYGFEGDTLLFGSSVEVIDRALEARQEGVGLTTTPIFQDALRVLPERSSIAAYIDCQRFTELRRLNTTEQAYQQSMELVLLEAFDAIGIGMRFTHEAMDGVVYLFFPE